MRSASMSASSGTLRSTVDPGIAQLARACASVAACLLLAACARFSQHVPAAAPTTLRGPTMGTTWSVKLVVPDGRDVAELRRGIQREVDTVVAQMSTYEATSDLNRYNRAPAGTWQALPPEFFGVLDYALSLARDTGGAYDPSVGPLVDLWGFGPGAHLHEVPSDAAISTARERVGYARIRLDPATHRALQPGHVQLDLSSVAKGFGTDQVARYLEREGVTSYLVDISGELRAHGKRPDGGDWQVGIEKPGAAAGAVDAASEVERVVRLREKSMATSGDYRHFFEDAGRYYSHHIDPRTGRPVEHRIASITTIADDCMHADSIGTALMVLGVDAGLAYARERGLAVLMLVRDGDGFVERTTPAFDALMASP